MTSLIGVTFTKSQIRAINHTNDLVETFFKNYGGTKWINDPESAKYSKSWFGLYQKSASVEFIFKKHSRVSSIQIKRFAGVISMGDNWPDYIIEKDSAEALSELTLLLKLGPAVQLTSKLVDLVILLIDKGYIPQHNMELI